MNASLSFNLPSLTPLFPLLFPSFILFLSSIFLSFLRIYFLINPYERSSSQTFLLSFFLFFLPSFHSSPHFFIRGFFSLDLSFFSSFRLSNYLYFIFFFFIIIYLSNYLYFILFLFFIFLCRFLLFLQAFKLSFLYLLLHYHLSFPFSFFFYSYPFLLSLSLLLSLPFPLSLTCVPIIPVSTCFHLSAAANKEREWRRGRWMDVRKIRNGKKIPE